MALLLVAKQALDAAKDGLEERLAASIKSLEKKESSARDSMLEMMMSTMRQVSSGIKARWEALQPIC
jgi:hypothetical protein